MKCAYRAAAIAFCLITGGFVVLAACSNQGEGERCDFLNENADCKTDEDLICYKAELLTNTSSDRCCPSDRTKATNPACKTPVDVVGNDAAAPTDTGPPPTADAAVTVDAAPDAPADAADDGG